MPNQTYRPTPLSAPTGKAPQAGKRRQALRLLPLLLLMLVGMTHTRTAQAQQVAIKTNGLMLAATMPNVGCEFVVGERSTLDLSLYGSKSIWGKPADILGVAPEYRYWISGRPMTREFVGIAAMGTTYDIEWGNKLYQGDAAGIGITLGYCMNLGKRLNVEFTGGVGTIFFSQKQYYKTDNMTDFTNEGIVQANANGYKLLPMKLGVSVTYILK